MPNAVAKIEYAGYVEFCPCGHVCGLRANSEALEKWSRGIASSNECPVCNEDHREQLRRDLRVCSDFCDPETNGCEDGCSYEIEIQELDEKLEPKGFVCL